MVTYADAVRVYGGDVQDSELRVSAKRNRGGHDTDARAPTTEGEVQAASQELYCDTDEGSAEPVLRVPEELTPLPAVDAAMPLLGLFATVVGRKRARYKIALLKTLQADGSGRWKIRRLQEIVHWLEPASVTEVVAELRVVDVLAYEPVTGLYRLTPAARVVTALLDAMTIPEVHPRALIKFLNKAMALAQAGGAGDDVVLRQFRSAIAVLHSDWEDLTRLIDDFSDTALLEAAELVRVHVDDMRDLLDEHQSFFATQHDRALFLDADQEALDLIARLGKLAAEVIEALSGRASGRMRAGLRVDRVDIREFLLSQTEEQLAGLFADIALPAPFVVALSPITAFEALADASERVPSSPPPLPPASPPVRQAPERLFDPAESMHKELRALGAPTTVAAITVRATWGESIARHSALVDAYSRYAGLPRLDHERDVEELVDSEVWRVSKTMIQAGT
jgi:hypothetical protein